MVSLRLAVIPPSRRRGMLHLIQRVVSALHARTEREEGQTLVEYALIIALVSVALVGALTALAGGIEGVFDQILGAFGAASS
jgi:pilus assembly protein Flp/PilA